MYNLRCIHIPELFGFALLSSYVALVNYPQFEAPSYEGYYKGVYIYINKTYSFTIRIGVGGMKHKTRDGTDFACYSKVDNLDGTYG